MLPLPHLNGYTLNPSSLLGLHWALFSCFQCNTILKAVGFSAKSLCLLIGSTHHTTPFYLMYHLVYSFIYFLLFTDVLSSVDRALLVWLYSTSYWVMIPFWSMAGTSSQVTRIAVEEILLAVTLFNYEKNTFWHSV